MESSLANLDFGTALPPQPRVFIKPNLTFPTYRPGVMTSPAAVEALIVALQAYTSDIWVGDADSGGYNRFAMEDVYRATGVADFASRQGVHLVNLSHLPRSPLRFRCGQRMLSVDLPLLLTDEVDAFITMPVPKVHMYTGVSLTFKNQWGCIPEPNDRLRLHPYFKEAVVQINLALKSPWAVIDGRFGLNRSGPLRGDVVPLGWLCATNDLGAGARIACELMRVPLEDVPHLRYAASLGLVPRCQDILTNEELEQYKGPQFFVERALTDLPGYLAFRSSRLAHVAYFSRWAAPLHRLLYRFREPFYDYAPK